MGAAACGPQECRECSGTSAPRERSRGTLEYEPQAARESAREHDEGNLRPKATSLCQAVDEFQTPAREDKAVESESDLTTPSKSGCLDVGGFQEFEADYKGQANTSASPSVNGSSLNGYGGVQDITYPDRSTYRGQVVNGLREGNGTWTSESGQYTGQWQADAQHGSGRQEWSDGRVYEGEFLAGRFSGHGCMTWDSPQGQLRYEGQYIRDLKHGHGKFLWPDGRVYDGSWHQGKRHGQGSYSSSQGQSRRGRWDNDKFKGWDDSPKDSNTHGTAN
eukprot:TRINITY_DN95956_c0_g1_i1.p1 TRINITY_DN95956_c0_g1~~TRINITY_DN95956_c0_g1_i1.p1  ORF type:complete len:276 (+),score=31.08 TRINITY_DN95956_c0_g1_i1:98-925(+)